MKKYTIGPTAAPGRPRRVEYERELNEQQRAVVLAPDGPILVIAGAGSGKTRTLTYRVARLIETGTPPNRVLLVTFTNKAAREMLRRASTLAGFDMTRVLGGTFHHVGHILLRQYGDLVGLDRQSFSILDREDAKELMDAVLSEHKEILRHKKFPKGAVLEEIHSLAINLGQPVDRVIMERYPVFGELIEPIRTVFRKYEERKRRRQCVDFDDLLVLWKRLLEEHEHVRNALRERFRHILVDEYQDTNRLQAEIVETIAGPEGNLLVVGDDAQSIYSFRGANFGNIIDFPKRYPNCRIFRLEYNYRSVPEILALANSSIRHNARQFAKVLRPVRPSGLRPEIVTVQDAFEQARFVADRIIELREQDYALGDIAVLYRAHWHSMEIQMELQDRGIPFQVRSGVRFFEQAHIKDVVAFLRAGVNPRDEIAWKRVLKLLEGIGRATAEKVWQRIESSPDPVGAVLSPASSEWVPKPARPSWSGFRRVYERLLDPQVARDPAQAIQEIIDWGYRDIVQTRYTNAPGRLDDLRRLMDYARRFDSVSAFVDELTVVTPVAGEEVYEEAEPTDTLVLSTIHQAKGLEWRAVFLVWLVDGKMPDARALRERAGEEEERRLFYVACTRAKDRLFLVHPTLSDERGRFAVPQRISRFLEELDPTTYETAVVE